MNEILTLRININQYCPISASGYVDLPKNIKNKNAVVNIKNNDEFCFLWAVISALYPAKSNLNNPASYPHFKNVLKFDGINFPMQIKNVPKFEKMNNLRINIFYLKNNNEIVPIYVSKFNTGQKIPLLMVRSKLDKSDGFESSDEFSLQEKIDYLINYNDNYHYMWIKNESRLFSKQVSKHNGKIFVCPRCLNHFTAETLLKSHTINCSQHTECKITLPEKVNNILKFKNYSYKEKVSYVIYADFECLLRKRMPFGTNTQQKVQEHVPFSIAFYLKCDFDDSQSFFKTYRGEDCAEWFVQQLKEISKFVEPTLMHVKLMENLTAQQKLSFSNATACHICEKPFNVDDVKVRDHCHITGKMRGAAHLNCNLNYKIRSIVPVVLHNLSNNDANFLIKAVAHGFEDSNMYLLPINNGKFISFSKRVPENGITFRFIDSYKFMSSSLEILSSLLTPEEKKSNSFFL